MGTSVKELVWEKNIRSDVPWIVGVVGTIDPVSGCTEVSGCISSSNELTGGLFSAELVGGVGISFGSMVDSLDFSMVLGLWTFSSSWWLAEGWMTCISVGGAYSCQCPQSAPHLLACCRLHPLSGRACSTTQDSLLYICNQGSSGLHKGEAHWHTCISVCGWMFRSWMHPFPMLLVQYLGSDILAIALTAGLWSQRFGSHPQECRLHPQ